MMNYMDWQMHREAQLLRTKIDLDPSGMVFVVCAQPPLLLSLLNSDTIQDEIERGIKGAFWVNDQRRVDVFYAGDEAGEAIWAVIDAGERLSKRAA